MGKASSWLRMLRRFWPLLLPLGLFLELPTGFAYPSPEALFSDLAISHYPNARYLKEALRAYHTIPLWSPAILSGFPFAADMLSGLWYPFGWLALLFPLPLGFNLLVALHVFLGGVGMYVLLRKEGLGYPSALFGALAWESLPKLFAQYGAGHLTLLYAIPWTPWLLWANHLHFTGKGETRRWGWIQPGLILALIAMADVRWAAYAGLLWVAHATAHSHLARAERQSEVAWETRQRSAASLRFWAPRLGWVLFQMGIAVLIALPAMLPLLEYANLSTRKAMGVEDILGYSLPPARLMGLLFPDFGGYHEFILYPGGVVLLLALVALLRKNAGVSRWFWVGVAVFATVYALGANLPFNLWVARLPGFNLLRVPSRALFITGLALAALAAHGLDGLLRAPVEIPFRWTNRIFVGLVALSGALLGGIWLLTGDYLAELGWGAGVLLAGSLWVSERKWGRIASQSWWLVLVGLALVDWGRVNATLLDFHPKAGTLSQQSAVVEFLNAQGGEFRVYSPSYSIPQHVAAENGLRLADGVAPLQLEAYARFMEKATGVPHTGYSVTIPPFATGNPARDNADYRPDPTLLGLLQVRYVVAEFDIDVDGLVLRQQFGQSRVYENQMARSAAWVESGQGVRPARVVLWTPNRVVVTAEGPGTLVLSEIMYPGWFARVDGRWTGVQTAHSLLRAVPLEAGVHQVEFLFRPASVYWGLAGFGVGLVVLLLVACRYRWGVQGSGCEL